MSKIKKELEFEALSVRQKIGMAMCGRINVCDTEEETRENTEYALEMMRNHSLGAVWVDTTIPNLSEVMEQINEAADYPILIMRDAECGINDRPDENGVINPRYIGGHNALGTAGNPEIAYAFGKVTAIRAKKQGYNVVCNPVLDMYKENSPSAHTIRSMGSDKYKVAVLGVAQAQGLKDAGVLTVGKHYPSATWVGMADSHMAEVHSDDTLEKLLDYNLYPYQELIKRGLLDGIMTSHARLPNVDPDFPTSLSKKTIDIIRNQGFDGFAITDGLVMMGIAAKFGARECRGLSIQNGNDLALIWTPNKDGYEAMCESYDSGILTDERLDEAVKNVLNAQHKTLEKPKFTELTEEDIELCDTLNRDCVFGRTDEGLTTGIDTNAHHLFVILAEAELGYAANSKPQIDQMPTGWHKVDDMAKRLKKLFPNSDTRIINEFPSAMETELLLQAVPSYDDVVFVTYNASAAYIGYECLTSRVISIIEALQVTNSVSTVVHFGNPFVLEDLPHIPRILIGATSVDSVNYTFDILAGKYPAKGVLSYDVKFK